jgi:hypothetical protein
MAGIMLFSYLSEALRAGFPAYARARCVYFVRTVRRADRRGRS